MKTSVLALLALAGALNGCSCASVHPGHVGIKVNMLGSSKGVQQEELPVGWHIIGVSENFYDFPTFEQNYTWTKSPHEGNQVDESFTFQTKEGLSVNADIGITYHIEPDKATSVFQKYRRGLSDITHIFLRNNVRDALNEVAASMPVEAVYGAEKIQLLAAVQERASKEVGPIGITISKIYLVGEFRLPETVVKALNSKIEATQLAQQRENEIRSAEAEAKKKVAAAQGEAESQLTIARAQAEANKLLSESLTPALVEFKRIEKWNGVMPQVTSGASPLLNIGDGWKK